MCARMNRRRPLRLPGYDYAQPGAYFVTICTHGHIALFGTIADGTMRLNGRGRIVHDTWLHMRDHYPIDLDAFVVMPNHIHGIVVIGAGLKPAPTLSEIVRGFKTFSARQIGQPIWQRNFYEHIVRNEAALERIRQYITDNPAQWPSDHENHASCGSRAD
jgi:putative transposase